ncbi:hypothetical protein BT69DRAFT_1342053 [Atractiella rhizophila]|nr:hypothetical protein BT69DRAFT_1342053 [Atractiella rhizophila]
MLSPQDVARALDARNIHKLESLFAIWSIFWKDVEDTNVYIPIQLHLHANLSATLPGFSIRQCRFDVGEGYASTVLVHDSEAKQDATLVLNIAQENRVNLGALLKGTVIFQGLVSPSTKELSLQVSSLTFDLEFRNEAFTLQVPTIASGPMPRWVVFGSTGAKRSVDRLLFRIRPRLLKVEWNLSAREQIYAGEQHEVVMHVRNGESFDILLELDLVVVPADENDQSVTLKIGPTQAAGKLKWTRLGELTSQSSYSKSFHLLCKGIEGARVVEATLRCTACDEEIRRVTSQTLLQRAVEFDVVDPFHCSFDVLSMPRPDHTTDLLSLKNDVRRASTDVVLSLNLEVNGHKEVVVECIDFEPFSTSSTVSLVRNSQFPLTLGPDVPFTATTEFVANLTQEMIGHDNVFRWYSRLRIFWHPSPRKSEKAVQTEILLPLKVDGMSTMQPHVRAVVDSSFYRLHEVVTLEYSVANASHSLLTASMQLESSECVFAGLRNFPKLNLIPGAKRKVQVQVIPIVTGIVQLPHLKVWHSDDQEQVLHIVPTGVHLKEGRIFVIP